jgi:hypothetical protein
MLNDRLPATPRHRRILRIARGRKAQRQRVVQKGEIEGRKARRLRGEATVAESPLPQRALETIDPPSLAAEQADALFDVAYARKMRVEALEITEDSGIHRASADEGSGRQEYDVFTPRQEKRCFQTSYG